MQGNLLDYCSNPEAIVIFLKKSRILLRLSSKNRPFLCRSILQKMYNIDNRLSYSLVLKSTLTTIYRYAVCQLWYDWTIVPNGFLKTLWLEDRGFKSLTFPDPCNSLWSFEQGRYILQYFCKRKFSKKYSPKMWLKIIFYQNGYNFLSRTSWTFK